MQCVAAFRLAREAKCQDDHHQKAEGENCFVPIQVRSTRACGRSWVDNRIAIAAPGIAGLEHRNQRSESPRLEALRHHARAAATFSAPCGGRSQRRLRDHCEAGDRASPGCGWQLIEVVEPTPGLEPGTCGLRNRTRGLFYGLLLRDTETYREG